MTAFKRIGIMTILAAALLLPTGAAQARHWGGGGTNVWVGPGGVGFSRGYGGYGYGGYGGYGGYYSPYSYGYGYGYPYRNYYYSYPSYGYYSPYNGYYGYGNYYSPGFQMYVW